MSDDRSHLSDTRPLGKSVEEIERDSQNLVNPPAREHSAPDTGVAVVPPVNATGTWASQTGLGASTPEVPAGPLPRQDD
ncbi:hypothetical protein LAJ19_13940 (plasmid) [Deinococcus taeanensis]|uniref:hypothetical protein n=1 Tax=Deinococcus taeanensis TaxID=2737050 RepID=UPI001CDCDB53|nr:hypothetical protein [Deinococcus taeanensis]UBV44272.1 hypothetical protein LAJ19_13940 [Deinococcus taeanensis]